MNTNKFKLNKETVNFFRFRPFGKKYLITNDIGEYVFLSSELFRNFLAGKLDKKGRINQELAEKGFIKNCFDQEKFLQKYRQRNSFLVRGPSLFILIPTLRCNHQCIYCQASSRGMKEKRYDMNLNTARKTLDFIFQSPSSEINIEFQGGEPLINWGVLKFIIGYAKEKNKKAGKNLSFSLVSNFSLLDEKKLKFLLENNVSLTTSLDGPEKIHNKNRLLKNGDSYKETTKWIQKIKNQEHPRVNALLTISKYSLKSPKEIVNEYIKWGFGQIHLRPLSYLGLSGKLKDTIGYSVEEFMDFWKKSIDHILSLNIKGIFIRERGAEIMLRKILERTDPNYTDLRSPCGAATGQLVFNFDGKIYTCDEGRMVEGDYFLLGNVKKDNYKSIMNHPTTKTLCIASLLENTPCDNCVYKPFCGICPVQNYALHGNLFPQSANNERCKFHVFAFDYLFNKLENKKTREIFKSWLKNKI